MNACAWRCVRAVGVALSLAALAASCTSTGTGTGTGTSRSATAATAAPPPVEESPRPPPLARVAGAVDYQVDPARSQLRVLVYRAGPLAAHGHDHVIVDGAVAGWIRAGRQLQDSAFYLQFSPLDFSVDPPQARAEEGPDFAAEISDEARAGTRRNLLGPLQLDAQRYPLILVQSVSVQHGAAPGAGQGAGPGASQGAGAVASLRVTIAGRTRLLSLPFTFERESRTLHASADFRLNQSQLGLEPLRVLLGQLQVQDEMHLKLDINAVADQAVALE